MSKSFSAETFLVRNSIASLYVSKLRKSKQIETHGREKFLRFYSKRKERRDLCKLQIHNKRNDCVCVSMERLRTMQTRDEMMCGAFRLMKVEMKIRSKISPKRVVGDAMLFAINRRLVSYYSRDECVQVVCLLAIWICWGDAHVSQSLRNCVQFNELTVNVVSVTVSCHGSAGL